MAWQLGLAILLAMLASVHAAGGNVAEEEGREGGEEGARRHGSDADAVLLPCMLY